MTLSPDESYTLRPIGVVRSPIARPEDAPMQGYEGAPDAWIELDPAVAPGLEGIETGENLIVITWLHRALRNVLQVHPRDDERRPLAGVFRTRSQDRPNPLGLHRVTVREIRGHRLLVGPLEAIDGTPIVDIKAVLPSSRDS